MGRAKAGIRPDTTVILGGADTAVAMVLEVIKWGSSPKSSASV